MTLLPLEDQYALTLLPVVHSLTVIEVLQNRPKLPGEGAVQMLLLLPLAQVKALQPGRHKLGNMLEG
jgi:hypothetical protein